MENILIAVLWFLLIGGVLGILLSVAAKIFHVKKDPRIDAINAELPGANCGGCGFPGCGGYARAIVENGVPCNKCAAGGDEVAGKIAEIMGTDAEKSERYRAQVMCAGTCDVSKKKYVLDGIHDCVAASRLAGGDKMCPNGCIGLGTCAAACKFDAIKVVDGVAQVDYAKCKACGACVDACPKGIIKLIPFEANYWVSCMCVESGAKTTKYCSVGCIGCKLCEKNCPADAIHVTDFVAKIDYSKCIECGKCKEVCKRGIIQYGHDGASDIAEDTLNEEKIEEKE